MLVRPAEPDDAAEVAAVHVRSWQVAYRGLLPDEYLDGLRPQDRATRYTFGAGAGPGDPSQPATIVAVEDAAICGFATTAPARDADLENHAELCALYVHPTCWGLGVGRTLIADARERMAGKGYSDAILWVMLGNMRAERFYRIDDWLPDGSRRIETIWGTTVDEVRYRTHLA